MVGDGLLIEAAKQYKVKGLGITLSEEQYKKFKERIKENNLEDLLDVRLMDYRELKNSGLSFDRVVQCRNDRTCRKTKL